MSSDGLSFGANRTIEHTEEFEEEESVDDPTRPKHDLLGLKRRLRDEFNQKRAITARFQQLQASYEKLNEGYEQLLLERAQAVPREEVAALKRQLRHLQKVEKVNEHFQSDIDRIAQDKEALKQQVYTMDAQLVDLRNKFELSAAQSSENEAKLRQENRALRHSNETQQARISQLERLFEGTPACEQLRTELEKSNEELRKQMKRTEKDRERQADENVDLQSQLSKKNLELAELKQTLVEHLNENARLLGQIKALHAEVEILAEVRQSNEALIATLKPASAEAQTLQGEMARVQASNAQLREQLQQTTAELREQSNENEQLTHEVIALKAEKDKTALRISNIRAELGEKKAALEEFENEKATLSQEIAELTAELTGMQDHLGRLLKEKETAILQLKQVTKAQKGKLKRLQSETETASSQITQLRSEVEIERRNSQKLATELDRATIEISQKSQKIDHFRDTIKEQSDLIANAQRQLQKYESIIPDFNRQREENEALQLTVKQLTEARDSIQARVWQLGTEKSARANLEAQLSTLQEEKRMANRENCLLQQRLTQSQQENGKLTARLSEIMSELSETRENNDHLLTQLKELSEARETKSSDAHKQFLLGEVNALKEANSSLEDENSDLRRQLLALASTSDEFVETIRKQIQNLRMENERNDEKSYTIDLTEINETLCAEIDRLKARLLAFEEGSDNQHSANEIPELLGRYKRLGKKFTAITKVSEQLNLLVENAHRRNKDLELEVSSLRAENLALAEENREKERSNHKLLEENERMLTEGR
jgi:chromosome segregation ATPase